MSGLEYRVREMSWESYSSIVRTAGAHLQTQLARQGQVKVVALAKGLEVEN